MVAGYFQANIANPKILVMAIMLITSVVAGIFSAGPAGSSNDADYHSALQWSA